MKPEDVIRTHALLEEIKDQLSRGKKLAKATQGRLEAEIKILGDEISIDAAKPPATFVVKAFMKTDDDAIQGDFDAVEWLSVADSEAIESVCQEHGPSEATDALFWWHDNGNGSSWSRRLARNMGMHMNAINDCPDGRDECGFSVRIVDVDAMFEWIKKFRPRLYADVRHLHGG